MPTLFDPLSWLATKGATASLVATGEAVAPLRVSQSVRQDLRHRIWRVVTPYLGLLKLQLDVESGTRPRTVQQLLAAGRVRVVAGRVELKSKPSTRLPGCSVCQIRS